MTSGREGYKTHQTFVSTGKPLNPSTNSCGIHKLSPNIDLFYRSHTMPLINFRCIDFQFVKKGFKQTENIFWNRC